MKRIGLLIAVLAISVGAFGQGQPVNVASIAGSSAPTGNGTAATSLRVAIASDNTAFSVNATLAAETTKVIGTVNISSSQTIGLAAGSQVIGHVIADTGSTTVVTGNVTVVQGTGTNLHIVCDSGCGAASTISLTPAVSGGLLNKHFVAAATDNATNVVSGAHQVYEVHGFNNAGYPVYLKLYNATSATGCGATGLYKVFGIQAGTEFHAQTPEGWAMGTGISYCLVKGITDADDTSVALSDAAIDIAYD